MYGRGLELRLGNNEKALATFAEMDAIRTQYLHPRANYAETLKLLQLGEIEYMNQARDEALAWITTHPARFLGLTAQRITNLWVGPPYYLKYLPDVLRLTVVAIIGLCLALPKLKGPQRAAFLIPLAAYPLVYYIVAYEPRYRIPIDWILYTLAGVVVWMILGGSLGTVIPQDRAIVKPG